MIVRSKVKVKAYLFHNHNKLDGVPILQRHIIIIKIYSDLQELGNSIAILTEG
jgi:hypothetical protein